MDNEPGTSTEADKNFGSTPARVWLDKEFKEYPRLFIPKIRGTFGTGC